MTEPGPGTSAELPPDLGALEDSITPQAWESRAAWVLAEAETEPERAAARTALESLHLRDEPGTTWSYTGQAWWQHNGSEWGRRKARRRPDDRPDDVRRGGDRAELSPLRQRAPRRRALLPGVRRAAGRGG